MQLPNVDRSGVTTFVIGGVIVAIIMAVLYWLYPKIAGRIPPRDASI